MPLADPTRESIGTEAQPHCYLCGGEGRLLHWDRIDYLFGAPGKWHFKRCINANCGLIWLDPRPTPDEIGKAYRQYYTHNETNAAKPSLAARLLRAVLHGGCVHLLGLQQERKRYKRMYLDDMPPGKLLEVGCGNGKRLARLYALGWDVIGQEIDPLAAEYMRREKGIEVHLGALETLPGSEQYDAVILSHVIEHVHDPVALLTTCHRLLRTGGRLVMLTPNADSIGHCRFGGGWSGLEPPRHLHLFTCRTLVQLVQKAHFASPRCWTTAVGAYGIGESRLPGDRTIHQRPLLSVQDVWRGFRFQWRASWELLFDKNSGEECVAIVQK